MSAEFWIILVASVAIAALWETLVACDPTRAPPRPPFRLMREDGRPCLPSPGEDGEDGEAASPSSKPLFDDPADQFVFKACVLMSVPLAVTTVFLLYRAFKLLNPGQAACPLPSPPT